MKDSIEPMLPLDRFLRESDVRRITGLSRAQRRRMERAGRFPHRVPLSDRAFGWIEDEIRAWVAARVSAREQSRGRAATTPANPPRECD
jgi:prophage regulatory protein